MRFLRVDHATLSQILRGLRSDASVSLDIPEARAQHSRYVTLLRELGVEVQILLADEACPDCCFIETPP